jgi:hypothetical protein
MSYVFEGIGACSAPNFFTGDLHQLVPPFWLFFFVIPGILGSSFVSGCPSASVLLAVTEARTGKEKNGEVRPIPRLGSVSGRLGPL